MSFADSWKRDVATEQDDFDPPDGPHTARLIDANAFTARTSSRDKVKLTWQIVGTDHAGRQFDDLNDVDATNPTGRRITNEKLLVLGLPADFVPDDIDDLSHAVFKLIGAQAEITVKHKDGWLNVYVNSALTGDSDVPTDPPKVKANGTQPPNPFSRPAAPDDDEIPF